MLRSTLLTFTLVASLSAFAQTKAQDDPVPPATGRPAAGIQGQNILDVKPEVKPDASSDPDYMKQNNAERKKVQPGNNAPMWRSIAAGVPGNCLFHARTAQTPRIRNRPQDRAVHAFRALGPLGERDCVLHPRNFRPGDGVRKILPAARHRPHAVRVADL